MTNARELVHLFLLAPLFVLLKTLPRPIAQPFDREPTTTRVAPALMGVGKLTRPIVAIVAGELDKTSEPFNPIPMPENRAEVRSPTFEGRQLLFGALPAGLGRGDRADGLAKPGFRVRSLR